MDTVAAVVITLLILAGVVLGIYHDENKWGAFAAEHECRVTGKSSGNTSLGIGSNGGVAVISNPSKTGYTCNDGVTYWR